VHNRSTGLHEIFSYNLYPGPSAKKGVYGALIQGRARGLGHRPLLHRAGRHPYDNVVTIMHEGASGGGKSEMLEQPTASRRPPAPGQERGHRRGTHLELPADCELHPVTDDMALCHPPSRRRRQAAHHRRRNAWFVRVNHITATAPTRPGEAHAHPPKPLLFLNIDAVPGSTRPHLGAHRGRPGKPCPNPRVIMPREIVPNVVDGPVRSTCAASACARPLHAEHPTYGILGLFHVLPPALAWLWRLVAPRGHANPSIVDRKA
jgi:hypothetical protein